MISRLPLLCRTTQPPPRMSPHVSVDTVCCVCPPLHLIHRRSLQGQLEISRPSDVLHKPLQLQVVIFVTRRARRGFTTVSPKNLQRFIELATDSTHRMNRPDRPFIYLLPSHLFPGFKHVPRDSFKRTSQQKKPAGKLFIFTLSHTVHLHIAEHEIAELSCAVIVTND